MGHPSRSVGVSQRDVCAVIGGMLPSQEPAFEVRLYRPLTSEEKRSLALAAIFLREEKTVPQYASRPGQL